MLLVVGLTEETEFFLSPLAPESLVSRVRFGRPVLRQPAHSPHPYRLNLVFTYGMIQFPLPTFRATISIKTVMSHRASLKFIRSRICVTEGVLYRKSASPGPVVLKVAQRTGTSFSGHPINQYKCTPLFPHTHWLYTGTVGMCFKGRRGK